MKTDTVLLANIEEYEEIEELRKEVFNIKASPGTYYLNGLIDNKIKAVAAKKDDKIIAGCYFHSFINSLVIDQVFVKENYQETGLKLGRKLLLDLFNHKKELEKLLNTKLYTTSIEPIDEKAEYIYRKIGYKQGNKFTGIMHKSL